MSMNYLESGDPQDVDPQDVAQAAGELVKAANAYSEANKDDEGLGEEEFEAYMNAAEKLVKILISSESQDSKFLTIVLRAVADAFEKTHS